MRRDLFRHLCCLGVCFTAPTLWAEDNVSTQFDTSLLIGSASQMDLSHFVTKTGLPVGEHLVDVFVNHDWKGHINIQVNEQGDISLNGEDIDMLSLKLSDTVKGSKKASDWVFASRLTDEINVELDANLMQLNLQVPQAYLISSEVGYVHSKYWQRGEPALFVTYNADYYRSKDKEYHQTDEYGYVNLNSGLNLFGWYFRDSSSFSYQKEGKSKWRNNTRYLQRSFGSLLSDVKVGDIYTPSSLFDSLKFRGVTLAHDMGMRPNSERGFAPIVRGVARTNALVKIYQNQQLIYQETVPPGEFALTHLQPTSLGGDLSVVIQEADGTTQNFTVPFASVPNMLKEGIFNYNVSVGESRQGDNTYRPTFGQAEAYYGINNLVTVYGGAMFSSDYSNYTLGTGWNLPIGAVSLDASFSKADLPDNSKTGQSFRITYSKFVEPTNTNFTLGAYRYSTKNYYTFSDVIYAYQGYHLYEQEKERWELEKERFGYSDEEMDLISYDSMQGYRPRNTFTINVNQQLQAGWGSLYITGTHRDYWNRSSASREYQLGYSNSYKQANYNFSVSEYRHNDRENETMVYFRLSLPLNLFDKRNYFSSSLSFDRDGYQQTSMSVSGIGGSRDQYNYTLTGSNRQGGNNSAHATLNYSGRFSELNGSYSESSHYRQASVGMSGSIVALPWDVVFGNSMGDTFTVIDAPKAKSYKINGDETVLTDSRGLALAGYSTPYRRNSFTLSNTDESSGADVLNNIQYSVPYRGSVNRVSFETDARNDLILRAEQAGGKPLPFGAEVTNMQGENIGYVGQASTVYLKVEGERIPDSFNVRVGAATSSVCQVASPKITMEGGRNVCR